MINVSLQVCCNQIESCKIEKHEVANVQKNHTVVKEEYAQSPILAKLSLMLDEKNELVQFWLTYMHVPVN